ncbi:MAG: formylglycine-generating enzyme family protein [Paludibacteraceae bacterium]|nr:formylglycine-generating enzyme family protein [Paludibacteraceae bacterium]
MKKYFSFLLVAALFAACTPNNEIGTPFKAGQEVTISAQMPNAGNNGAQQLPGKQRVSGIDAGTTINLTWDEGDQIKVIVGEASATFTLESGAGETQATFKGIMPADGTNFSVQYPVEEPDLSNQTYVPDGFGKGLMKMATETNGTIDGGFTLSPQHALLGLQLKGSDALSKIVLTNRADSKTYTLACADVTLTEDASTLFYIVVPQGEWPSGFKVEVYAADNSILNTFEKTGGVSFGASAVAMPEQDVNIKSFTVNGVSFRMIAVKKGTFKMGATEKQLEFQRNELGLEDYQLSKQDQPAHYVTLTYNYHIGETEVTQELWEAVMDTNPSRLNGVGYEQYPVDSVSWDNCQAFVTKLNEILKDQLNGKTFRLPTNAEWEYAARGGHKKDHDNTDQEYIFAGSDDADEVAWYSSIDDDIVLNQTQQVKEKEPNELGLYDMSGNVEEWCQDNYYKYTANSQNDPINDPICILTDSSHEYYNRYVVRGGRWQITSGDGSRFCRVGYRDNGHYKDRYDYRGLRLALVENK